ncbi:MAG: hypothetical protein QOJ66_3223, partial [Ilumatobacteraceae bacterium]
LGLSQRDFRVGLLFSAGGFGALISGLLFSRVFRPARVKWITPTTIAISSLLVVGLVVSTSWIPAVALLVLFSWSIGTTITTGITYRQLAAPDDLRSSVNVFGRMISWGGQPFGAGIGAFVSAAISVRAAYIVSAAAMAISATAALLFLPSSTEIDTTDRSGYAST